MIRLTHDAPTPLCYNVCKQIAAGETERRTQTKKGRDHPLMLKKTTFIPFTHGEIKPQGWLLRQLRIQADGLSGHLDKVWPDIRDSKWIGGDRDGWERVPYWLDGFVPLAYLLDDDGLKARAKRYIDGILARQEEDGWICPCAPEERDAYDVWAFMLILKVLALYADLSGDERIPDAMARALRCLKTHLHHHTLFGWGSARWYECLIPIFWLYERTGEEWLIDLCYRLRTQGMDYTQVFEPYRDTTPQRVWTFDTHVVNMAMCLKQEALMSRLTGGDPDAFALRAHELLKKYHGMAVGHFTGDECVAGTSPVQGSELCSVVEAMYSFEQMLAVSGNPHWADEAERLAFNALPATTSADMWTHQYDQQTNQIRCQRLPEDHVVFGTNGPESHLFGLEPNFGCCTANFNQGWPKLAMSAFMCAQDGVASCLIVPSEVRFAQGEAQVAVALKTDYPFKGAARYTVTTDRPTAFTLYIRIPSAAKRATVNGEAATPGEFFAVSRTWEGEQQVDVSFTFACELTERPGDMRCLWRGPLLYSVAIDERWERREYEDKGVERKYPYCDYEITPQSAWNYAFADAQFDVTEREIGAYPFDGKDAPVEIAANLAPVDWPEAYGVCLPAPQSRKATGPARRVRMIPYGCTNLRMTEMPMAEK